MKPNFLLALMDMMKPRRLEPSKKQATKKNYKHEKKEPRKFNHIRTVRMTQHERVVAGRAAKIGVSPETYVLLTKKD
jgi:hypothetical protein